MKIPRLLAFLCQAVLLLAIGGCGSGNSMLESSSTLTNAGLPLSDTPTARGSGRVVVTLHWPTNSHTNSSGAGSRLIPAASNSVVLTLKRGATTLRTQTLTPAGGAVSTTTFSELPIATLTLTATAYPNSGGTGVAQAAASTNVVINAGQTATPTLTMASTVDHFDITAAGGATKILVGATLALTATAKDTSGNIVLTTPGRLSWTSSDTSKVTVNATGLLTGVGAGTITITATDSEHGKSGTLALLSKQLHIYIADSTGSRIIRMDDMIGTNKVTYNSGLLTPTGVFVQNTGKIYISDLLGGVIRLDDVTGTNRTIYNSGLLAPSGAFVDSAGKIYIADKTGGKIVRSDDIVGTNRVTYATGLVTPVSVFVDSAGKIYIADLTGGRIIRMDDMTGTNKVTYNTGLLGPSCVYVDSTGKIYIADNNGGRIIRMDDMTGTNKVTYNTGLLAPAGICVDSAGKIYIADFTGGRIIRMDDMTGTNKVTYNTGLLGPSGIFVEE